MDKYVKFKDVPKGKRWEHFWTYYKMQTIAVVLALFALIPLLKDVFFKEKVDIVITHMASEYYWDDAVTELDRLLELHARDFDGNGERVAKIDFITLPSDDAEMALAAQTRIVAQFQDKNSIVFLMDEAMYTYVCGEGEEKEELFADLSETVGGSVTALLGEDKTRLYLKDIPAYQDNELLAELPDDLFFAMRIREHVNPNGKEALAEIYDRGVQMMENLAAGAMEEAVIPEE